MASANAIKRLPQHLKELRIHLCQRSPSSQGVREWVEKYYVDMKKANPKFPILIRECSNVNPVVYARYASNILVSLFPVIEFGRESSAALFNLNSQQVNQAIQEMANKKLE
ncbi:NADH dehydrogenase [ubiquinone] 1 alpha subcomplex subunit 2 [Holothuria leucospilota]|uniref:NADH dehydrogenase [ubiquinone] 1 alpha subcomplex subunit 2 n=1 Tax=Holothuria leucospilota TaxID=206669 RepID=A0A9Q1GZU1_HOLLE|nr:NADH dehydrogenase [ubiquinone] 1 alpha subcomplex subunit 2 [Holothuria leucospilota]